MWYHETFKEVFETKRTTLVYYVLWDYWLLSFNAKDTKLERFLHKNQHAQRKLLNFENWTYFNGTLLFCIAPLIY